MTDDLDSYDDDYDDIARRLRGGVGGVQPRHDAIAVVQHHVGRRRRRRRVVAAVASVVAVAVVVPTTLLAVQLVGDGRGVEPAEDVTPVEAALDGSSPVAYFVDTAGGRARGQVTRYRAAAGERYYTRFLWWPQDDAPSPVFAGVAVEQYDGTAADACAAVVVLDEEAGGVSSCTTTADGTVLRTDESSGRVALDAVRRRGFLEGARGDDQVRAVTAFRADGWAVSLVICGCTALKDNVDLDEPPMAADEMGRIVALEPWVPTPYGKTATAEPS